MRKSLSLVFSVFLLCAFCKSATAQNIISTIAGTGTAGYSGDGGLAVSGKVNYPYGVTVDGNYNVYIADAANNRIRMIAAGSAVITTIAGTGTAGYTGDGAAATAATLRNPTSVAVDASGNIFIADMANNCIREISAVTGNINTIAGTGVAGYSGDGAAANLARLNSPYGIALDAAGNVYIADALNHRVRVVKIATGVITTVAGTGIAGATGDGGRATFAKLNTPKAVAVDASGNIYIADTYNDRIREVTLATGNIATVAGNGTTAFVAGLATASGLYLPSDVIIDPATGNYYISDAHNNLLEMVTIGTGAISVVAGTGVVGYNGDCQVATDAQLAYASGVAIDGSGNLYVADSGNNRVRLIAPPCAGAPPPAFVAATYSMGCAAYYSTLTASGVTTGCGISYQWEYSSDGVTFVPVVGATGTSYIASVTSTSYYEFVITCTSSGTSSTSSILNLVLTPGTPISPIINGFTPMCTGQTTNLASTTSGGVWSVTNADATITSLGFLTAVAAGIDTVLYSVTESCGVVSDTFIVTIDAMEVPSVTFNFFPGNTVCPGDSVTINAIAVNGGTTPTLLWKINGVNNGSQDTIKILPSSGDTVTCTITSNYYCASPNVVTDTAHVNVTNFIRPGISVSDGGYGDSVCNGTILTFMAVDTNGGAVPVNTWFINGVAAGGGTSFTYTPFNGDTVQIRLISSFICASPDTVYNTRIMSVYNVETPAVTIFENYGDTSCTGINTTFTAHPIFGGLAPGYRWSVNRVNVGTGPTYTYLPSTGDSVYCMMLSSSTCRSTDTVFSNAIRTTVAPFVVPYLTLTSNNGTGIDSGAIDTITASVYAGGITPIFRWFLNDTPLAGVSTNMYISDSIKTGDAIKCIVASSNPCADPDTVSAVLIFTVFKVGVNTIINPGINATVIPNPNNGSFIVKANIGNVNGATIAITNLLGQEIYKQWTPAQNGKLMQNIDLTNDFTDGMYLLHITSGDATGVIKFTISR